MTPFLWILVGYLACDGIVRLGIVLGHLLPGEGSASFTREVLWQLILGCFSLLLLVQIIFRSFAARISITLLFLLQVVTFVQQYVVLQPQDWWSGGVLGRLQLLVQVVFLTSAVILLNTGRSRRVLCH
ncbi:MAG: hypothetical protein ACE5GW_02935 [Planctomycetota bacterium]